MSKYDSGPSMATWDVSLYTGYNTTASQNAVLMRRLIDKIDALPLGSRQTIDVAIDQIPFTLVLSESTTFLQSISKTNQTLDITSGRYSLLTGKSFSMGNPVFDPLKSLVLLIKIDNKVSGYKTLRVLKTVSANDTHESLIDATDSYSSLVGQMKHQLCVIYFDTGASKCGSVLLPPAVVTSLIPLKTSTAPSCEHPHIPRMVYSIMDIDKPTYYCATDPTIIDDLLAFSNSNVVTQIPKVEVYYTSFVCHFAPTGNSFRVTGSGFLDTTPNATAVMLPLSLVTNRREMGIFSRIDYIIQTQVGILVASRIATALLYLILLIKFSWTNRQNLLQILVENITFEVTNKSPVDTTAVLTLAMTYWTYREIMLSMVVRQCLSPLPWNSAVLHTYMDDLIFIPGPVCYVFLFGLCAAKHILHSFQICVRLAYVAVYLAIVILVAGAVSNQGPAFTALNSAEPYSLKPTLVAPMILYYYRTSQHVDSY
ncbi:unnamed protein product [Aphanomyces euteiches]